VSIVCCGSRTALAARLAKGRLISESRKIGAVWQTVEKCHYRPSSSRKTGLTAADQTNSGRRGAAPSPPHRLPQRHHHLRLALDGVATACRSTSTGTAHRAHAAAGQGPDDDSSGAKQRNGAASRHLVGNGMHMRAAVQSKQSRTVANFTLARRIAANALCMSQLIGTGSRSTARSTIPAA
jgi:hypothetical protein